MKINRIISFLGMLALVATILLPNLTFASSFSEGSYPTYFGLAISPLSGHDIYTLEDGSGQIQRFNSSGTFVSQFGVGGYGSANGQFAYAYDLTFDSSGNIYVADTGNNRIQKLGSDGSYITKWGSYGSGNTQFSGPEGIASDGTYIYVSDTGNNRIVKYDLSGTYVTQWGTSGSGDTQFDQPVGIAFDATSGDLFVADSGNNRIKEYSTSGTNINPYNAMAYVGLSHPQGVTVDSSGYIYVLDSNNHQIWKFDSEYGHSNIYQYGHSGSDLGGFGTLYNGISVDSSGNIYVADNGNYRIQKFNSNRPADGFMTPTSSGPQTGGTVMHVDGAYMSDIVDVTFDGVSSPSVTVIDDTQISVVTPAHSAGAVAVRFIASDSKTWQFPDFFTYTPVPIVTSTSPASGRLDGGTIVNFTGTGLSGVTDVTFDGTSSSTVTVTDAEHISAVAPAHGTAGAVDVILTDPVHGVYNIPSGFTYTAGPFTCTYTESNPGFDSYTWNTAANWDNCGNTYPQSTDDVVIPSGLTANLYGADNTIEINSLSIYSGGGLNLNDSGQVLTINGSVSNQGDIVVSTSESAGDTRFIVAGNWDSNSFDAAYSTVELTGWNQTISGSTTFYNLTKQQSWADTLTFESGSTQTITGTLTLNGDAGQPLSLRATTPGSGNEWFIAAPDSPTLDYLDVQDSTNNGTAIAFNANFTDSGNNTNWGFAGGGGSSNGISNGNINIGCDGTGSLSLTAPTAITFDAKTTDFYNSSTDASAVSVPGDGVDASHLKVTDTRGFDGTGTTCGNGFTLSVESNGLQLYSVDNSDFDIQLGLGTASTAWTEGGSSSPTTLLANVVHPADNSDDSLLTTSKDLITSDEAFSGNVSLELSSGVLKAPKATAFGIRNAVTFTDPGNPTLSESATAFSSDPYSFNYTSAIPTGSYTGTITFTLS